MANKTVAAVVKLIDEFSDPSRTVARQSKNLEKRIGNLGSVFENAGQFLEGAGESLTKSVSVPMAAAGTAAFLSSTKITLENP